MQSNQLTMNLYGQILELFEDIFKLNAHYLNIFDLKMTLKDLTKVKFKITLIARKLSLKPFCLLFYEKKKKNNFRNILAALLFPHGANTGKE